MEPNPYESPRDTGRNTFVMSRSCPASILWFLPAAILANVPFVIFNPRNSSGTTSWDVWEIWGSVFLVMAIAVVSATITILAYGLLEVIFKRRRPATMASRFIAGVMSAVALGLASRFLFIIEFEGPSVLVLSPTSAITASVADRLVSWLVRTNQHLESQLEPTSDLNR